MSNLQGHLQGNELWTYWKLSERSLFLALCCRIENISATNVCCRCTCTWLLIHFCTGFTAGILRFWEKSKWILPFSFAHADIAHADMAHIADKALHMLTCTLQTSSLPPSCSWQNKVSIKSFKYRTAVVSKYRISILKIMTIFKNILKH